MKNSNGSAAAPRRMRLPAFLIRVVLLLISVFAGGSMSAEAAKHPTVYAGVDYAHKESFQWISCIRLPEFVTREEFGWAVAEATRKKKLDFSAVEFMELEEGLCVQCMHLGPYDDEPATVDAMHAYAEGKGYAPDISDERRHHEIYLSDARRTAPEKLKTVIRHPIRRVG